MKPVVVIGAGFSGVTTLKICLENGLDAHCYEKLDNFGGLWRFRRDVDVDGVPSVTKNTIIDSSKEFVAFSDFPPPPHFPNFMHNTKMIEYLGMYIEANKLQSRIHLNCEITSLNKAERYSENGEWIVAIRNKESGEDKRVEAQAVLVCTGHHAFPNYPTFQGQENFTGPIVHSHSLKSVNQFDGKSVVVVGVGNSGMDAAAELSFISKQVFLSTRKGVWITPRMGRNGLPHDFTFTRSSQWHYDYFRSSWLKDMEGFLNSIFDHSLFGVKPRHRFDEQHISVSDVLPARILAGAVQAKGNIAKLTSRGVIFENDEKEYEVDAIVLCTGYDIRIPFLSEKDVGIPGSPRENDIGLFERIFPVRLQYPTLAFIGLIQPSGPLFPLFELQARWVCRFLRQIKSSKLTDLRGWTYSLTERSDEVIRYKRRIGKRFVTSQRHTMEVDYVAYMEDLSQKAGCRPNLHRLIFTDPVLWYKLVFGPYFSYQFRLEGAHSWPGARDTIFKVKERVKQGFGTGCLRSPKASNQCHTSKYLFIFTLLFLVISLIGFYAF